MRSLLPFGLLLLVTTSCVQVSYDTRHIDQAVDPVVVAALQPGKADLTECLARLGAPRQVFEYQTNGMALAWVCRDSSEWGIEASVQVIDVVAGGNANFSLDLDSATLPGVVLWFGPDLILERAHTGLLGPTIATLRHRGQADDDSK